LHFLINWQKNLKKTAIITGAGGNLGQAVAKKFMDSGYSVIGTLHAKSKAADSAKNPFEEVTIDLLNERSCQKFVQDVVEKQGKIDVAVLTAGGFTMGNIESATGSDIYKQYQLNFETTYNIARFIFIQMMQQNSGRIFLIGSRQGLEASKGKGTVAYTLSKSLIFRLAEILNAEAKGKDVVTSIIVPSTIDTPQNRKSMPEADFSAWVKPSEIAGTIFFYSGEEAKSMREPVIKIFNRS
jgi:NAD(P)-dependent dehydrogenase (short-subunit alcohol dehydrogenase family)